jgi:bifunctional NMN adenylyltransferase/nudix hydrolase
MRLGVIIARFQVPELTEGHKKLIEFVKAAHGQVLVCLGTTPVLGSKRNPLDYATRAKMLHAYDPDLLIAGIEDQPSDTLWSEALDKEILKHCPIGEVALYGGRDSFIPYYSGRYKTFAVETELSASGTDIRQVTANRIRVSADFRAGIIYATHHQYKRVFPTVDIGLIQRGNVLLGRKPNETHWRFPGGFVDQTDDSLEMAATREALEETGVKVKNLKYVCSHRNKDWRYKHSDDGVVTTTLFSCDSFEGDPKAGDDIQEVSWYPLHKDYLHLVVDTHKFLFEQLVARYGQFINQGVNHA